MSAVLPPLPPDWSEHESSSHPGHFYYYNRRTGAKTWDRATLVEMGGTSNNQEVDVRTLEIRQLEKLLAAKKKEQLDKSKDKLKEDDGRKKEKRKTESVEPTFKKRQKIVFDLKKKDEGSSKGREGRRKEPKKEVEIGISTDKSIENNTKTVKDDEASTSKNASTTNNDITKKQDKSNCSKDNVNISSDSSLYGMDDDEMQKLKVLKSKYSSSPRPKVSSKSNSDTSPANMKTAVSSPVTQSTVKPKYLPENYGSQYVNYQKIPKDSYQRVYKPRDRPVLAKLNKGELPGLPLASSKVKEPPQVDLNRTPEQHLDITPVYGSLEDSFEGGGGREIGDEIIITNPASAVNEVAAPENDKANNILFHDVKEDSWGERSWEGERPPTPPLVQEMQEEESMEWESVDREEILKETHRVRALLSEEMEVEEAADENNTEKIEGGDIMLSKDKALVVVDTNVFISSLGIINHLMEEMDVKVVIPWMVVQELDGLKTSTSRDTAVRARAAVRWLHGCLQRQHQGVLAQTAEQNRRAASRFESRSADDRILACCLVLKDSGSNVTLLTNDINLANKGLINKLVCGDAENIVGMLSGEERVVEEGGEGPDEKKVCSELIMQGENTVRDLLEAVLRKEFRLAFGDKLWEKMISIKPKPSKPHWALSSLFTLFSKHHIAVFGLAFPRNGNTLKQRLESVKEILKTRVWRVREVKGVLLEMSKLFGTIKERDNYEGIVDICTDKLSDISSQLESYESVAAGLDTRKILTEVDDDSQEVVQELFQNVWEIIACFTRGFASSLCVENSLPKFDPDIKFQSRAEATRHLPAFFHAVSTLQESMVGVVSNSGSGLPVFYSLLTQFRANIDLDQSYWPAIDRTVTMAHLEMFIIKEENQEVMKGGLDQISEFRQILISCISGGDGMNV